MKEQERPALVELSAHIQQLHLQLEQYQIHAASLTEGSYERNLVARVQRRMEYLSTLLRRREQRAPSGSNRRAAS